MTIDTISCPECNYVYDATDDRCPRCKPSDTVREPSHYILDNGLEFRDVIKAHGWHEHFWKGNALKYLWRAGKKGGKAQEIEDLKKARQYIDMLIEDKIKGRE